LPLWIVVAAPLIAAFVCGVLALTGRGGKLAPVFTVLATIFSAIAAFGSQGFQSQSVFPGGVIPGTPHSDMEWLALGHSFRIVLGVHLDHLALLMVGIVCFVNGLVQIYSVGYMKGEVGYARYFAYLALFTASMLGLVVADNLFQLYVCWELVGICSYLLIGFWWHKPSASNAAKKAFVVTRFGDVGFLLGVLMLVGAAGSFRFTDAFETVHKIATGAQNTSLVSPTTFLWLVPILLFCGAIGKSAQFPLHVWLPDAMEGPTPVSALIHAATMVAAGVYMVARLFTLFEASQIALTVVLVIGTITAFIAATIAMVQFDIKKVMAYSTVSQLGYMMMGLGAGGRVAGMFHLTTHAMFKALLFLTAGSVIHALHHAEEPNNLKNMGGLLKRMPQTAWSCAIGVLALAGLFPLSGFWSKDAVLGAVAASENSLGKVTLAVGVIVAGLTAFYSVRMWLLAFWGEPRSNDAAEAHESPFSMTLSLWSLAIPSIVLGAYLQFGGAFGHYLGETHEESVNGGLALLTSMVALVGMAFAWKYYSSLGKASDPITTMPGFAFLDNLWGIDGFWNTIGARGTLAAGRVVAWFDRHVVDGIMNGIGWLCGRAGATLRRTSNGQAQSYAGVFVGATVVIAVLLVLYASEVGGRKTGLQGSASRVLVSNSHSRGAGRP
jgi:NADH-quinone oxidoreductase subunit L